MDIVQSEEHSYNLCKYSEIHTKLHTQFYILFPKISFLFVIWKKMFICI